MKILISGYHNPHYQTITEYIERAVCGLGHEVIVFNDRKHIIPGRLRHRCKPLQAVSLAAINSSLVRLADKTRPDLVIVTGGHRITRKTLRELARRGFRVVLWTTDRPDPKDIMRETVFNYDRVFCQGTEYVDIFKELGVSDALWLPMGCDPEIHSPVSLSEDQEADLGSDVVFVGSFYPYRAENLEALRGFNLAIWGPGWENLPGHSALGGCVRGAHTPPHKWVKIYSASKIVLALHNSSGCDAAIAHQASPRVFEALACGAFVLTDCKKDVLELFRSGEHLTAFADAGDLREKVAHFLSRPAARQRIAAAGRREVLKNHTYQKRLKTLIDMSGASS